MAAKPVPAMPRASGGYAFPFDDFSIAIGPWFGMVTELAEHLQFQLYHGAQWIMDMPLSGTYWRPETGSLYCISYTLTGYRAMVYDAVELTVKRHLFDPKGQLVGELTLQRDEKSTVYVPSRRPFSLNMNLMLA